MGGQRGSTGVPQNYERAAELYQQAAAKGHAGAQYTLGALYYKGMGVPKDVAGGCTVQAGRGGGSKTAADFLRNVDWLRLSVLQLRDGSALPQQRLVSHVLRVVLALPRGLQLPSQACNA